MVRIAGDLVTTRETDRDRGLVGPISLKNPGSTVLANFDIGRTIAVEGDGQLNNTVTLPAAGTRIGDHLDLFNNSAETFRVLLNVADSKLLSETVTILSPYSRIKCKVVAANTWALSETFEEGVGGSILQQSRVQLSYQASDQQTLPTGVGTTPSLPGIKLDLSLGTVESDRLGAFRSATDDFIILRTGFYEAEMLLTLRNNTASAANCYGYLVVNGAAEQINAQSLRLSVSGELFLRWKGLLVAGDVVDFRAAVEGAQNVGLRSFHVVLEQLVPLMLDHTYSPAAIFSLNANTTEPAIGQPLTLDQYVLTSGAFSKSIKSRGQGVFELGPGKYHLWATGHYDFNDSGNTTQFRWTDVTAVGTPFSDAGTPISEISFFRASNVGNPNHTGGRSICQGLVEVAAGSTKFVKIEKIATTGSENEQRSRTQVIIRRVR